MSPVSPRKIALWILCALGVRVVALAAAPIFPTGADGAPNVNVSGTVTDASGHGWPLFAQIHITSASTDALVFSDPVVANWTLIVAALCNAPGYGSGTYGPPVLAESFDGGVIPAGWTVENASGGVAWEVYTGGDPCGAFDGNRTGGSGPYAIVNSDCGFSSDDTSLITPPVDLSSSANAAIRWNNSRRCYS